MCFKKLRTKLLENNNDSTTKNSFFLGLFPRENDGTAINLINDSVLFVLVADSLQLFRKN